MDNVFSTYHPAVAFVFLACVIVFSMAAISVYVVISFIGAFIMSCVTRGFKPTARSLVWISTHVAHRHDRQPAFLRHGRPRSPAFRAVRH